MLRELFKSDLPQIMVLEQKSHAVPWSEETFKGCLASGYVGWVIEVENKVVGFVLISQRMDECHILNICVAPECKRQGWATKLIDQVMAFSRKKGVKIVYLEVRKTNLGAIALYQKMRFKEVGVRKDYYVSVAGNEDALIFALTLDSEYKTC